MPFYDYECAKCDKEWETQHAVAERHDEHCCGVQAKLVIRPTEVACYDHYKDGIMIDDHSQDPNDAVTFYSKKDHTEWLKRNDLHSPAYGNV